MKTFITTITVTICLIFAGNSNAQVIAVKNTDATQSEATTNSFSISGTSIKPAANGFTVAWEANNQFSIASYELQLSENNSDFSTVKRRASAPEKNVKYQVQLTNTVILASTVYIRIKVVTLDGQVSYTESKKVRIEGI